MGGCQHLLGTAVLAALILRGIVVITGNSVPGLSIHVRHEPSGISLHCDGPPQKSQLRWSKDGRDIGVNGSKLLVGSPTEDPRGLFECHTEGRSTSLQLYFRTCQYCIQMNWTLLLGLVAAQVVVMTFLGVAVWHLAALEPGRLPRASDKQTLLAHDQLYQPLGERSNGQYSRIGVAKARGRR